MSAMVNSASPRFAAQPAAARRAQLSLVSQVAIARNPKLFILGSLVFGFLVIALLNLLMTVATSSGVYQVAQLKAAKQQLALQTQIVGQQVTSLSSDQNLSNAAATLGMVSNSTPVFLSIAQQKVYGTPTAATASSITNLNASLVPNAAMTTQTQAAALTASVAAENTKATAPVVQAASPAQAPAATVVPGVQSGTTVTHNVAAGSTQVNAANSAASQVVLGSGIPAAPSH